MIRHALLRADYLALICALAACGDVDKTPLDAPPDAAFPTGAFRVPQVVAVLAQGAESADDDDPTLPDDMLEIYFASTRTSRMEGDGDIWRSTRATLADAWSPPVAVTELNRDNRNDDNPGISGDGLTIWISSNRDGDLDIYVSTRADRSQPWSTPTRVAELSPLVENLGAEPARSQLRIATYGDSPRRLFEATRTSESALWSASTPIDSLNQGDNNQSGFFVTDLELWFASTRPGGAGGHDIYRAVRPSVDAPFGTPTSVQGINSELRDDDPWLSPDGHTLYFVREVDGNQKIYVAERP